MQIIYQDEDKGRSSRRTNTVGLIVYARSVGRHIKGKYFRRFGRRITRV